MRSRPEIQLARQFDGDREILAVGQSYGPLNILFVTRGIKRQRVVTGRQDELIGRLFVGLGDLHWDSINLIDSETHPGGILL